MAASLGDRVRTLRSSAYPRRKPPSVPAPKITDDPSSAIALNPPYSGYLVANSANQGDIVAASIAAAPTDAGSAADLIITEALGANGLSAPPTPTPKP